MKKMILGLVGALMILGICRVCAAAVGVDLEKIVVTPVRMEQCDYETGSNVTLISESEIEASDAQDIAEILGEKAGINVYDAGTAKTTKLDIRGFADTSASNILVMIDGRRVNSIDISGPDWIQIPLESVEQIEVIRGGASVLYGDKAVGGVVNIITKKGKGPFHAKAGGRAGSYHMRQADLEVSGSRNELSYYFYAKYFDTNGYRANSDVLAKDWDLRLACPFSQRIGLDVAAGWHEDDYGLPGGLNESELRQLGRRGSANPNDYASTKDRYVKFSINANPYFGETNLGELVLDVSGRNRDVYSWFDYGIWGATADKNDINAHVINAKYSYQGLVLKKDVNIVTGIDYYKEENDILGSGSGVMASTDDLTITKDEWGVYGYCEFELLRKLYFDAGGRYQKADYTFDQLKAAKRYETQSPKETVFTGGLNYKYAEGSNIHCSGQQTFRFLATDEWYDRRIGLNTNLSQQRGAQYEAGVRHNFGGAVALSATSYLIDLKNEIYLNPDPSPGQNENYDKTRRAGVELGLESNLLKFADSAFVDNFDAYATYAYQVPKFRKGAYDDKDIPMVPRHQASAGLKLGVFKNYNLSVAARYVGERYAINDTLNATPKVKNYITCDTKVFYKSERLEAHIGVDNIFNEKYYSYIVKSTSSSSKDHYPAPERNFEIGASYKF